MKEFNITGICVASKHYMVDTTKKLEQILELIHKGKYFTMNRPRQYGKTTTLFMLQKALIDSCDYLPVKISFEGIGDTPFESPEVFCPCFLELIADNPNIKNSGYSNLFYEKKSNSKTFKQLSDNISEILVKINKKIVLMIDEVDKSSNNDLFLFFLGMLRDKYLLRNDGLITFHSVILAGVHDTKTLKYKICKDNEKKFNSPWNIAVDFFVDMWFNVDEISTMLQAYAEETNNTLDIKEISERLFFWTNGYPFLVSKLCKTVDERVIPKRDDKKWYVEDIDWATRELTYEVHNTLFDSITHYLNNDEDLFDFIQMVILGSTEFDFDISAPNILLTYTYGVIDRTQKNKVVIHNRIFTEKLTKYIIAKLQTEKKAPAYSGTADENLTPNGNLDFARIVRRFQAVVKENYAKSDLMKSDEFLEKNLRLMFIMFVRPIINGNGFCFKEAQIGEEKRLDLIITFQKERFLVELKIWRGEEYHKKGITQLKQYMQLESASEAFMLIMNKNRKKAWTIEKKEGITIVWL